VSLPGILLLVPCVMLATAAAIVILRMRLAERAIPKIEEGDRLPPAPGLLSIVIPAHNEARVIEESVRTLRRQTRRNIEVTYVLDRCTDRTRELLVAAAAGDDRIRFVENDSCPADWAGKCNACRVGASHARGEWILFTDADCRFAPELLDAMLAIAESRGADLTSAVGRLTFRHRFERLLQPVAALVLFRVFPLDKANRRDQPWPFANGQFLLFRRERYRAIGGHDLVKDALLEDLFFAWRVHRQGGRVAVVDASSRMEVAMYETAASMRSGWTRILIESCNRTPRRLVLLAIELGVVSVLLPLLATIAAVAGSVGILRGAANAESAALLGAGLASLALGLAAVMLVYARQRAPIVWALGHPIGAACVAWWLLDGARMLRRRIPIRWGGREYVLEPRRRRGRAAAKN
jgi:chlorobactene glucosyltransferase